VGNIYVKRFLGLRSDLIFVALKRIKKNISKSLNRESIVLFREKDLLTDWEYNFSQNTMRKRNLTTKQLEQRERINRKVLEAVLKRGFHGPN
ncbi:hypothetical protein JYU08_00410, partial [bacterium AH-315-B06]|nr:hypothetical protein [bacterium AH-315-B06]